MGGGINHISLYINTIAINTPQNINDKYFTLTANIAKLAQIRIEIGGIMQTVGNER